MLTRSVFPASVVLASVLAMATPAMAGFDGGGGNSSDYGDSLTGDLQRNPRLIEPGAERQRYLEYYGGAGWDRRQATYYGDPAYRPNVHVRPYRAYGY